MKDKERLKGQVAVGWKVRSTSREGQACRHRLKLPIIRTVIWITSAPMRLKNNNQINSDTAQPTPTTL